MIKQAMPSWDGEKIILHAGRENYGKGSYDPYRSLHTAKIKLRKLVPVILIGSGLEHNTIIDRFPLMIFEN